MKKVATKNKPDILRVSGKELTAKDLFLLNRVYEVDSSEFVISGRFADQIILNSELMNLEEVVTLINDLMALRFFNQKAEKILDKFEVLTNEKAVNILFDLWKNWRKTRREAELKENADDIIKEIRQSRIPKKKTDIIRALFDIGYGLHEDGTKCDFDKGALLCYQYGYLAGIKSSRNMNN